ncbi:MAG: CFI-box-CTERM domain-containing protein [Bacteroidota bacterium]
MKKALFSMAALWLLMFLIESCQSYKQVTLTPAEFYSQADVIDNFGGYDVYINGSNGTFQLKDPSISDGTVKGIPQPITDSAQLALIHNPKGRKEQNAHKYDLHIHTDKQIDAGTTASYDSLSQAPFVLNKEDIKKVSLYAHNKKEEASSTLAIVLILLLILALAGLIWLIAAASSEASNASSDSSNNSSGGSGSNSGSGSSSSGCYIATMVYGSYDAPEVMVLRKFRDERLSRSAAGRAFIKYYYRYSPALVEKLRNRRTVNRIIRRLLDAWVNRLSKKA